jgi:hypothetical protein
MSRLMSPIFGGGLLIAVCLASPGPASAEPFKPADGPPHAPPFTATLSNNTPLAVGMNVDDTAQALGTKLNYVSGRPGDEIFLTFRNNRGGGLFVNKDRLYLQFRNGRLAGWKGDWGHNWMWQ